ncbi:tail protein X [Methylocystis sp. WRRC1]|uniref:tail protein X n=1 Tax=unclassified Methylocystis TaxID=2625913 RepID=UPI00178C55EA|nr:MULTISPECIES: tail protein X [unclassified Methylocystis]MCC3246122.1 tail protein X [Methylocystis sp. WRRC1]
MITEPLRLDILAAETMGKAGDGAFEALLNANPGLADGGPYLQAPREVEIPAPPAPPAVPTVNPWE